MDTKIAYGILGTLAVIAAYVPYFRDIYKGRTKPHAYTWLIWFITQGTALVGLLYGGGGYAAWSLLVGNALVLVVFVLSFRYGTKNITRSDTVTLLLALCAIGMWLITENPLLSVLMVTLIDFFGYIPTMRKSYMEPWSETVSAWTLFALSAVLALLALQEYSLLTYSFLVMLIATDSSLVFICLWRRLVIPKPGDGF